MEHGFLRQATASQSREVGPFLDDTDFKTPETGLTIANTDVKLSINGAAGADKNSGGGTHRNNGMYSFTFDATDTATVGELAGSVLVSGALLVVFKFIVLEEAVYDALYAASAAGFTGSVGLQIVPLGQFGDADPGSIIDIKFLSMFNGVPVTLSGSPAVSLYRDNSLTQITTGVTLTVDFDGITGLNNLRIDTAGDPSFHSEGANFQAIITAGTVGGATAIGHIVTQYSIHNRSPLRPIEVGKPLNVSDQGNVGIDLAHVENPSTVLALSGTTFKNATDLNNLLTNIQGRIPAALVNGRMSSFVGEMDAAIITVLTGGGSSPSEFAAAVLNELLAGHTTPNSLGAAVTTLLANAASLIAALRPIRRGQAILIPFTLQDITNRPAPNYSITVMRKLDDGVLTAAAGTVTWVIGELYYFHATGADTNGAVCSYQFSAPGHSPTVKETYKTVFTEPVLT